MKDISILIAGVGGQGTLLTSRVLGNLALRLGLDVKISEIHGMAQRGGSVVTYVKIGKKVFSPLIEPGQADIIIAFEKLEAARWINYIKDDGLIIYNQQEINPMTVITGDKKYPDNIYDIINRHTTNVVRIDALKKAREIGNIRVVNSILLGILAKRIDIPCESWIETLLDTVPVKTKEINLKAFNIGYNYS